MILILLLICMMQNGNEIEGKILDINKDNVIKSLQVLKAKQISQTLVVSDFLILENADKVFATLSDNAILNNEIVKWINDNQLNKLITLNLRLRKINGKNEITYKSQNTNEKFQDRIELEKEIHDYDGIKTLLIKLGFKIIATNEKQRISFQLGDIRFDLDKYDQIPWLVEVESNTQENVIKGAKLLGFSQSDLKNLSIKELFEYYNI